MPASWAVVGLMLGAAYLIGAIPTGLIVGRVGYGVDLREHGSGNIGSTNAKRVLGGRAGYVVLALDLLKGFMVTIIAGFIVTGVLAWPPEPQIVLRVEGAAGLIVATGAAAVVGNVFPVYIGFKGGKGVGVGSGVLLAIIPVVTVGLMAVWLVVRAVTHYVSVASLLVAVLLPPLTAWRYPENTAYLVFALFAAAMTVFSHRTNIKRLIAGEEPRIDGARADRGGSADK